MILRLNKSNINVMKWNESPISIYLNILYKYKCKADYTVCTTGGQQNDRLQECIYQIVE